MKPLFTVFVLLILLNACSNKASVEKKVNNSVNLLHDIAPFTSDSLVNVVIEIPAGTNQKWEVDKVSGKIAWEQVTPDSLRVVKYLPYPANYGFVPQTLLTDASGGDGDPVDVFVLGASIDRGSITKVKIVGIINMLDDGKSDSKLLAVNINEAIFNIHTFEMLLNEYPGAVDIIKLWLLNYKGIGRVEIISVGDEKDAIQYLRTTHIAYNKNK
ncbi:MAG: inorganic diphosphatase [Lutibacter sp.]